MTRRVAGALAFALLGSACVYQVDTAIPDGESRFDPALIGTWVTEADTATISAGRHGAYRIEYRDDQGDTVRLEGRLGKLGERTILEVTPLLAGDESGDWPVGRLLLVLTINGTEARTQLLNAATMRAAVARDPAGLPYIRRGDNVILTAPSAQLMPSLRAFIGRPGALDDPATWKRIAPRSPEDAPGRTVTRVPPFP